MGGFPHGNGRVIMGVVYRPDILYEDNHLLCVNKRCGDIVQGDRTGDAPLTELVGAFLKERDGKPGNVFLGIPHRLDRPVSGVVVLAKTSKALSRMSDLFRRGEVDKTYWALTGRRPPADSETLTHWMARDRSRNRSRALNKPGRDTREASLTYRLRDTSDRYFLLEVDLHTGRHHQIRAQLAAVGCPVRGDLKYGAPRSNPDGGISLHARRIAFVHPVRKERLVVTAPPPSDGLWDWFAGRIGED